MRQVRRLLVADAQPEALEHPPQALLGARGEPFGEDGERLKEFQRLRPTPRALLFVQASKLLQLRESVLLQLLQPIADAPEHEAFGVVFELQAAHLPSLARLDQFDRPSERPDPTPVPPVDLPLESPEVLLQHFPPVRSKDTVGEEAKKPVEEASFSYVNRGRVVGKLARDRFAQADKLVANQEIEVFLTVEEAEALARAAKASDIKDRRTKALADQALDQIAAICRQVQDRVRTGDKAVDRWARSIPRRPPPSPELEEDSKTEEESQPIETPRPRYRPLGDPDNLSLKEAGEILGKARNTVYLWYRKDKFPPAVDVGPHLGDRKPVIVVPRYRLDAWLADERMPNILQEVFDYHALREPPWGCWTVKRGASREDVAFWMERRELKTGVSKGGRRMYGQDLEDGKIYEVSDEGIFNMKDVGDNPRAPY